MKCAVLTFPGSSHAADCVKAIELTVEQPVQIVGHMETDLSSFDLIIVPGGSSYGDYLRGGAIASRTPVVQALMSAAEQGKYIIGFGNGFQILLEAGLLPGAMLPNESLRFLCTTTTVRVDQHDTPFTRHYTAKDEIQLPVAHRQGNYYCDDETLAQLQSSQRIVFRYAGNNPNGSQDHIAGIINEQGNILGMMPLPERAVDARLGSEDGRLLFTSILSTWRERHGTAVNG